MLKKSELTTQSKITLHKTLTYRDELIKLDNKARGEVEVDRFVSSATPTGRAARGSITFWGEDEIRGMYVTEYAKSDSDKAALETIHLQDTGWGEGFLTSNHTTYETEDESIEHYTSIVRVNHEGEVNAQHQSSKEPFGYRAKQTAALGWDSRDEGLIADDTGPTYAPNSTWRMSG